jgi:predicted N-acetyltransferase YhbS
MASAIEVLSDSATTVSNPQSDRISIRPIREHDIEAAARAAFAAHSALAARQGHPSEHPSPAFSAGLLSLKVKDQNAFGFVAEQNGKIVGSVFLNRFPSTPVAAIGPLTVDPEAEGSGAGRSLLRVAFDHARALSIPQVRLVQSPAHLRSLALYSKAGFDVREPLVLMQSPPTTVSELPTMTSVHASTCAIVCTDSCVPMRYMLPSSRRQRRWCCVAAGLPDTQQVSVSAATP